MAKKEKESELFQSLMQDMLPRIDKIEDDLSTLVGIIGEESAGRRVFEERVSNAIEYMARISAEVATLSGKLNETREYMLTKVATLDDRDKLHKRVDGLQKDVISIDKKTDKNTWVTGGFERIGWIVFTAIATSIVYIIMR